jgi:hypothetical protein
MTVRKLRAKQRGPWCSYCDARAIHTSGHQKHSCTDHLPELEAFDLHEYKKNSYQTEGEWQALGRW